MGTRLREKMVARPLNRVEMLFRVVVTAPASLMMSWPLLRAPADILGSVSVWLTRRALPRVSESFCSTSRPRSGGTTYTQATSIASATSAPMRSVSQFFTELNIRCGVVGASGALPYQNSRNL